MRQHKEHGFGTVEALLIAIAIILISCVGYYIWHTHDTKKQTVASSTNLVKSPKSARSPSTQTTEVNFNGVVTGINNGCNYDGRCLIIVDDKSIITGGGLSAYPNENIYGTSSDVKVGDKVTVKALRTGDGFTLQGCSSCYIKRQ